jgi:hypothetical protein
VSGMSLASSKDRALQEVCQDTGLVDANSRGVGVSVGKANVRTSTRALSNDGV